MLAVPLPRAPAAALFAVVAALLSPAPAIAFPTGGFTIWTIAGTGAACSPATAACGDNGAAIDANLNLPEGVAVDKAGNMIFADKSDQRIRMVTPAGHISTIAGTGATCSSSTAPCGDGGAATAATFNLPLDVAVDGSGKVIVADAADHRIREFTPGGTISTIAGNGTACSPPTSGCGDNAAATGANFYFPQGVTVDHGGNVIVSDTGDDRIRRFARGGNISTIAGTVGAACSPPTSGCGDNGPATSATLNTPLGVAVDGAGDVIVADSLDHRIREFTPGGSISTIAGNGTPCSSPGAACGDGGAATSANLNQPHGVAVDAAGNVIVADTNDHRIRRVVPGGNISTIAGNGTPCSSPTAACGDNGAGPGANLLDPGRVTLDGSGNVLVADSGDHRIRWLTGPQTGPPGPTGATGPRGPTGPKGGTGPRGPAGRNAKVTCKVAKSKRTAKIKVTCKVILVHSASKATVRWRLVRRGRTVAHGAAHARHGRVILRLGVVGRLRRGQYSLRIAGRHRGIAIVID